MNENQNIPKLRFEGFTEPWEQHKLGDLAEIKDSARVPNNLWSTSGVPYIRASDVSNDDLQGVLFLFQEVFDFYRKKTGAPVRGDVLFNGGGEIGKSLFINTDQQLYAQGGAVLYARTSESKRLDGVFLSEIFQSRTVKKYIGSTSKGGTMKHFTLEPAKSMPLLIPNDVSEQHDIGFFLRDLDNLVTLYQHKYERLQHLKQALLRKMFPKPGEQVPELRFDGFTEPWKEYRLGDLGEVAMCKRIYKDQTSDSGDVPFFKIGTFGGKPDAYISNELFEEYRSKFPFPDAGDVLISAAGTIGRTVVYNGERAYYQDSNIVWLKHGDEINNLFFLQFLKVKDWKNLEGSTLKRLYNKDILETPIALPETAEQNAVGSFFRDIDSLITLHQRKYERLKRLKQALLRKMFV